MVWVAVFSLVCMAAAGLALVGIAAYLVYALARHLLHSLAKLVQRHRRPPKPVSDPAQTIASSSSRAA